MIKSKTKRPNIILIILDSARRDMFGCYGHEGGLTPNIDALAAESMVMHDHYAAGCGSTQAHVSIFLGQHSARHGVVHNLSEMKPDVIALPKLLQGLSYKTYGHSMASFIPPSGYEDLFGFDEFYYPGKSSVSEKINLKSRIIERLRSNPVLWTYLKKTYKQIKGQAAVIKAAAKNFDGKASLNFLYKKIKNNQSDQPVFAYTTLLHPHTPYYAPQWCFDHVFKGERIDPLSFDIQADVHAWINGDYGPAESALDSLKKCYQAELLYGDHLVGGFIKKLKNEGLFKNTILVITSDHGEMFGEHGQLNHGMTTWEEVCRLPCIIHYSGRPDLKKDFNHLSSNLDLLPSLFDLIGEADYPHDKTKLDGVSIMDQSVDWENRKLVVDAPPLVLPERLKAYPKVIAKGSVFFRTVRNSRYKYLWLSNGQRFMFPVGVYEEPANSILESEPEIAECMHNEMLARYNNINPDYNIEQYPINMGTSAAMKMTNPVIREELKKLGYL